MVLVDSSSWIESLRQTGRPDVRKRVESLLAAGEAAWCDIIRLELWNGVGGPRERKTLREFDQDLPRLPIDEQVWELSIKLANRARQAGFTVPAVDLLIAACARRHGVSIEHCDEHYRSLEAIA